MSAVVQEQGSVSSPDDTRPRVFISTSSFGKVDKAPLRRLEEEGVAVRLNPHGRTLTASEIAAFLTNVDGLIAGTEPLTRAVLSQAKQLRVISRCGTGLDNVDVKAAKELGIAVTATTQAHVPAVAELTLGAMIALLRQIPQNDRAIRSGVWHKPIGQLLRGRTVGIVGLGKVGKEVVRALKPFGARVLAYDAYPDTAFARAHDVHFTTLAALLRESDIVSLHLPYDPSLHHLLDRELLACMKPEAYLINTSRGGLVDEAALYDFLTSGKLAGAFLDTFEEEPYRGPLVQVPNVILSPHAGAYARESRIAMESEAVENLLRHLKVAIPQVR